MRDIPIRNIYLLVFDGFSDWKISYCTPEIYKSEKYNLIPFSIDGNPVYSAGGLYITPKLSLPQVEEEKVDLLILPGGTAWEEKKLNAILPLILKVNKQKCIIAAICGATIFLAENGLLNSLKHTSNDLNYLKSVAPMYKGEKLYQFERAVTDGPIITASGIAPIEFAREIFTCIKLFDNNSIEKWYKLFKEGIWTE